MQRLTVKLNIWVKPNELRQDHGWKSWFWSKVIYPFHENILIIRWKFWKNCLYHYYYETWNSYLNVCLLKKWYYFPIMKIIFKQSFHPRTLHTDLDTYLHTYVDLKGALLWSELRSRWNKMQNRELLLLELVFANVKKRLWHCDRNVKKSIFNTKWKPLW